MPDSQGRQGCSKTCSSAANQEILVAKFDYDDKDDEVVGEPDPLLVGRALED